jgi:hypothetical protein
MVPTLNGQMREFFIGFKPHGQSFEQSVADGRFRSLDPWYSASWDFRKSHIIIAASGAGTNYPVRILVHSGSGWDSGADVYCAGKCQSDFDDIRFTNSAGDGLLDYWLEGISGSVGTFWVEVADDLSSTSRTVYVYYGNSGASTTNNGAATFAFFDDFSSSPNGWTLSNSVISGGLLDLSDVGYPNVAHAYKSRPNGYDNYRFRFAEQTATNNMGWRAYAREGGTPPDNPPMISAYDYYYDPISQVRFITQGNVATSPTLTPTRDDDWHRIEVTKYSSSYTLVWDSQTATCTDNTAETGSDIGFCHVWSNDANLFVDWVFLSKFVSPEPGHGSWGQEERVPLACTFWGTLWYDSTYGEEPEERNKSGNVTEWIYNNLFGGTGSYSYRRNYWGSSTTANGFYGNVSYCDNGANFAYSTLFYKGHFWSYSGYCNGHYHTHYEFHSQWNDTERIKDNSTFLSMQDFNHGFALLWCCMLGNEKGGMFADRSHAWGFPVAFIGNLDFSEDGYDPDETDNSDKCLITFANISMPFRNETGYNGNQYAHFVYQFYNYTLNFDRSVKDALDEASLFASNCLFENSELYLGYNMTYGDYWRISKMRVFGDGDHKIPR